MIAATEERKVMTVLKAQVPPARVADLVRAYAAGAERGLPSQMVETFLVQDAADPARWKVVSVWPNRTALEDYRQTVDVPGGESERLWDRFGEAHRWIPDSLPHVEEFVLPSATHFPQIEHPRSLAEGLAAFFARHPLSADPGIARA